MAIDHVIDLNCVPKETLSTPGLLARLKARERAAAIIKLYRDHGDQRPPNEMGFEMVRRTHDGNEETQIVLVQDLIADASPLDPLQKHCKGCPANRADKPFGCFDSINYPISQEAELWLLKQLPSPDEPLILLLLRNTVMEYVFNRAEVKVMRESPGVFFETGERFARRIEDVQITTDQVFEMLFLQEVIKPAHAALLLLFFGAIPRDMDAEALMALTQMGADEQPKPVPFLLEDALSDDESITSLKNFFHALYTAYQLNVTLSLDV